MVCVLSEKVLEIEICSFNELQVYINILVLYFLHHPLYFRKIIAEAKLLVALYNEETANLDVEANIAKYKEAVECNKECEMSMVSNSNISN